MTYSCETGQNDFHGLSGVKKTSTVLADMFVQSSECYFSHLTKQQVTLKDKYKDTNVLHGINIKLTYQTR